MSRRTGGGPRGPDRGGTRKYLVYGIVVRSPIPLPLAPAPARATVDLAFDVFPPADAVPAAFPLEVLEAGPKGEPLLSMGESGATVLLRFEGFADCEFDAGGSRVLCRPARGTDPESVAHLLVDTVLPLALAHRGQLLLHASAVLLPSGAIGFVGRRGRGKSTLAAAFARAGFPVLADDALLVRTTPRGPEAVPGPPALRLAGEALRRTLGKGVRPARRVTRGEKVRVDLREIGLRTPSRPAPLRRLYILATQKECATAGSESVSPVRPREALVALADGVIRLDPGDREGLRREFGRLGSLAAAGIVRRAVIPWAGSMRGSPPRAILVDAEDG